MAMAKFIIKRLVYLVLVVLIITLVTYVIFFAGNGTNLAARFAGRAAGPQAIHAAFIRLGLEHGFWYQYWTISTGCCTGASGSITRTRCPSTARSPGRFP